MNSFIDQKDAELSWQERKQKAQELLKSLETKHPEIANILKQEFQVLWGIVDERRDEIERIQTETETLLELAKISNIRKQQLEQALQQLRPQTQNITTADRQTVFNDNDSDQLDDLKYQQSVINGTLKQNGTVDSFENHGNQMIQENEGLSDDACFVLQLAKEKLCFAGGMDSSGWIQTISIFEPSSQQWCDLPSLPVSMSQFECAQLGNKLVVAGGRDLSGTLCNAQVHALNLENGEWSQGADMLSAKYGHAMVVLNDKIYTIGGDYEAVTLNTVEMWDMERNVWTKSGNTVIARFSLTAAEQDGCIYAVGGFDGQQYLKSIERYDPREGKWSICGDMHVPRGSHVGGNYDGLLLSACGFDGKQFLTSAEFWDTRASKAYTLPVCPVLHAYGSGGVVQGKFYVYGGKHLGNDFNKCLSVINLTQQKYEWTTIQEISQIEIPERAYHSACVINNFSI
eukprot:TRINITY_DN6861_c0_g1_i5.p1 TRINITY_DN6861_c0_g1~~TRINITY_DN6861_c0_g1_i5.p1  ORF type:complete len:457 (-),score=56.08 TRINITY_DN6861_c0_g1_i5:423-1793(-)